MKNINKIIGIIGLLFCVLQPISAQFRMGIDWSCGMPKSYFYSTRYYDDEALICLQHMPVFLLNTYFHGI